MKNKQVKFWEFRNSKDSNSGIGELYMYGDISNYSWWEDDISPKSFKNDLDDLGDIETLNIYINSGGGDVFAGQAIYNILKRHKATKNIHIDGIAASIASVIAMAGDNIIMPSNALMMIHDPWTWGVGGIEDFERLLNSLNKIKDSIANVYVEKTGLTKEEINNYMTDETWFTADEALELGFINQVDKNVEIAASMKKEGLFVNNTKMNFENYKNKPKLNINTRKVINVVNEIDMLQAKTQFKKNQFKGV